MAQRAGKRFHAEDTENDEVISSFKQSFVESWQALMKMKLHPRLNSQARQLLDAMDAGPAEAVSWQNLTQRRPEIRKASFC